MPIALIELQGLIECYSLSLLNMIKVSRNAFKIKLNHEF